MTTTILRIAEFRSDCSSCDDPIRPGDQIKLVDGGEWEHAHHNPLPPLSVCSHCFTQLSVSGKCGCYEA